MTDLVKTTPTPAKSTSPILTVPAVIEAAGENAVRRFVQFFAASIDNPNTRVTYARAVAGFFTWIEDAGFDELRDIEPVHVAAYIRELTASHSAPTVKLHLAAIRRLFDELVVGQVVAVNPAAAVRGPKYSTKKGKTPVLAADEARALIETIPTDSIIGLRDRALIGLMTYTFARISASIGMNVEDVFSQRGRLWVRLAEKGGKAHDMPCHHNLEWYLKEYIEAAGLAGTPKAPLFQSVHGRKDLSGGRLMRQRAWEMVRRRAKQAGIATAVCNHTFRATGITAYLKNEGALETASHMAAHSSTRTTQLYDRRDDEVSLDEVERILI